MGFIIRLFFSWLKKKKKKRRKVANLAPSDTYELMKCIQLCASK